MTRFEFRVLNRDGAARRGELTTPHGVVQTPAFMPVGTRGAVKAVTQRDLEDLGAEIILGNTYHLYLKPGDSLIARCGGLHRFIGWNRPILTDSGGYQVFSLAAMRRIEEEGAHIPIPHRRIAAPADARAGGRHPGAARIGHRHGARRVCRHPSGVRPRGPGVRPRSFGYTHFRRRGACGDGTIGAMGGAGAAPTTAVARTIRAPSPDVIVTNPGQAQFGIIQGGTDLDLRTESVQRTIDIGFEAYAIGGLSVGEPVDVMYDVVAHTAPLLPDDQPRYLMGTGMPDDLIECVARGIDSSIVCCRRGTRGTVSS